MAEQAPKCVRDASLEANVWTESIPGLVVVHGIFVRADGTRLFTTSKDTLALHLPPSGFSGDHRGGQV